MGKKVYVYKPASNHPHINIDFYYEAKQRGINIEEVQYVSVYFLLE